MPTNDTPANAINITSLPYSITLDPGGAEQMTNVPSCVGSAFSPVWWKYTAPLTKSAVGINIEISPASDYYPQISAWTGTPPTLTEVPNACIAFYDPTTLQINVPPGQTIYFQIVDGNENDPPPVGQTITFEVEATPNEISPAGSLLISNDIANFPGVILDATDGTILRVIGFPSFECGEILPTGVMGCAAEVNDATFAIGSFTIFNQDLSILIAVTSVIVANQATVSPVTSNKTDAFFFARPSNSVPVAYATTIKKIAADGTVDATTWTLPSTGDNTEAIAVKRDESILYIADNRVRSGGTTPGAIHAYDLVNDVPLTDIVATTAGSKNGRDLILLADDTLLVVFCPDRVGAPNVWKVRQHDLSGTLLNTFSVPATHGSPPRICAGLDDPDSFWVMSFPTGSPVNSVFTNILIADGSTITTLTVLQRPGGDDDGPMFGPPQSCPLLLLPLEVIPPQDIPAREPYSGIYTITPGSNKTNDTLLDGNDAPVDLKIPNPSFTTGMVGDNE